jgi:hypothetical protein
LPISPCGITPGNPQDLALGSDGNIWIPARNLAGASPWQSYRFAEQGHIGRIDICRDECETEENNDRLGEAMAGSGH